MRGTNTPFPREELSFTTMVLRLFIGGALTFVAINRFYLPGTVSSWSSQVVSSYTGTYLPQALVTPIAYALPYVELVLGLTILLGLYTRTALALASLFFVGSTLGMIVRSEYNTAAISSIYIVTTAIAFLISRWDTMSLDAYLGITEEEEMPIQVETKKGTEQAERRVVNM